jgi:ribosomal protein S18 acetylase RimI-like enzyme
LKFSINDKSIENKLETYLKNKLSENAILLFNIKQEKELTDFIVAYDNEIEGAAVIYYDEPYSCYLHLRTDNEKIFQETIKYSIRYLKNNKQDIRKIKLIFPSRFSKSASFLLGSSSSPLPLIGIRKGEERLYPYKNVRRLTQENWRDIMNLLSENKNFDIRKLEKIREREILYGLYVNDELIVFTHTTFRYKPIVMLDNGYTKEKFRKMGYAKSLLSFVIEDLFYKQDFSEIQIYTSKENIAVYKLFEACGGKEIVQFDKIHLML